MATVLVIVDFIHRNENSEHRDKQNTRLSNCNNTADTYKSTISQDNNHQEKFKLTREKTSSSAVAKRPRDDSCLSVVSFIASILQYIQCSFFIIIASASDLQFDSVLLSSA